MRGTGYWNSDELNRRSEQVGKTSDVLESWKVERKEVRFELDQFYDAHKKSCDKIQLLEERNQELTKDNQIYLQMIEYNSDRIAKLTAQMEKLAKSVKKLEK
ncbi:hypothetical protein CRE_19464 [Caenorhabditis remanei]|uniref:Uncharacterized protein n=1 Tax=Caenorhabditis remanei TaxID=31234 RepID=E3NDI2_CAERE|nr:hypothetical protein CRE_19464 [Caenorhabditis remanei]